jgi:hypothetical protein
MKTFVSLMLLALNLLVPVRTSGQQPKLAVEQALKVELLKSTPQDDRLRKLQVQRFNEVAMEYRVAVVVMTRGNPTTEPDLFDVSRRLLQAALDFDQPKERVSLLSALLRLAKEQEKMVEAQHRAKMVNANVLHRFRSLTLEVEIHLVRAESKRGQ